MKIKFRYLKNRFLGEYDYYHRKIFARNRPEVFAIELTNFCNLNCAMCPRKIMKRQVGFMKFELFKNIIDQIKGYNDFVWLHFLGESLFHPQLDLFISYCADRGVKPFLSTNATTLTEEISMNILKSKLERLILCLDGTTEATYEKLRVCSSFNKTKRNILNFLELKKELHKLKPYSILQIIQMNNTEKEIEEFKKLWGDLADEVIVKSFATWAEQEEKIRDLAKEEHKFFPFRKERCSCFLLWRNVVINWNGDVVPCCLDFDGKNVLGSVNKSSLYEIWNSKKMLKLREKHIKGIYDMQPCDKCAEWIGNRKDDLYPFSRHFITKVKCKI